MKRNISPGWRERCLVGGVQLGTGEHVVSVAELDGPGAGAVHGHSAQVRQLGEGLVLTHVDNDFGA